MESTLLTLEEVAIRLGYDPNDKKDRKKVRKIAIQEIGYLPMPGTWDIRVEEDDLNRFLERSKRLPSNDGSDEEGWAT